MGALRTSKGAQLREAEIERARCAWLLAADLASKALGADVRIVMQTSGKVGRGSWDEATTKARKVACYIASTVGNVTGARLADATGMDRATIHGHTQWVEDRRDEGDREFDDLLDRLERTLLGMAVKIVMTRLNDGELQLGDAA